MEVEAGGWGGHAEKRIFLSVEINPWVWRIWWCGSSNLSHLWRLTTPRLPCAPGLGLMWRSGRRCALVLANTHLTRHYLAGLSWDWMNYSSAYMGSVAAADKSQSAKMDQSINLFTQDRPSHSLTSLPAQPQPPSFPPSLTLSPPLWLGDKWLTGAIRRVWDLMNGPTHWHTPRTLMDRLLSCSSLTLLTFRRWGVGEREREPSKLASFLCDEPNAWIGSCCCII